MRRERIERTNVVVGKEWLRVEMSQGVCSRHWGLETGSREEDWNANGQLAPTSMDWPNVQRGLCFGEAFDSVVKDHANWHRQVPFWLGLQTDTGVKMSCFWLQGA